MLAPTARISKSCGKKLAWDAETLHPEAQSETTIPDEVKN